MDLDKGTLELPPVVGKFNGKRGEFYNQQTWEGAQSLYAMSGSTFHLNHREWNSLFRQTAEKHGKLTGFASFRDSADRAGENFFASLTK